jgi:hypothetical protein
MKVECGAPLDPARLVDYWFGDLPEAEEARVEEHLFECGRCSARLQAFVALGEGVRRLAHEGAVQVFVSPSFLSTAARGGLRTREYRLAPGDRVACTVTPEDDWLVGRLVGEFEGVSRLDVVIQAEGHPERRIEDVPVGAGTQELIMVQAMPAMRALGRSCMRMRVVSPEAGGDRLLGEYTFDHTPSR